MSPLDWVISERQWKRVDRIAYARHQLEVAWPENIPFWQAVLSLYGVRRNDK